MSKQSENPKKNKKSRIPKWMGRYLDAAWGLRNHWYPAAFSYEVSEDDVKGVQICGEYILLRRANGKVYALKDECAHRGVSLRRRMIPSSVRSVSAPM